jgi:hypothetical protein
MHGEESRQDMAHSHSPKVREVSPPPLEVIGDLVYSPGSDLPFGKRIRIGLNEFTIYTSAVEKGYDTGVRAHYAFLRDHNAETPIVLDDKQFTMIIKRLLPKNLSLFDQGLWRSFFIVGWTSVYLGVAPDPDLNCEVEEEGEDDYGFDKVDTDL